MIAHYGYRDGSGEFFIRIETDKCDGCARCVTACPQRAFVVGQDSVDPLRDIPVAWVREDLRNRLNYVCAPCKPLGGVPRLPCVEACRHGAIEHSW